MRFEITKLFKADYKRLSDDEREKFRVALQVFYSACGSFVKSKGLAAWPSALRVKQIVNAPGVFEMTWSFKGPDGPATWEWTTVLDAHGQSLPAVCWRRLGSHQIFKKS